MVTMSWRMSAIRRGLTPQVFATNSLHLLCTFIEHTETIFIEHTESNDCAFEGEVGATFALKFKSLNFLKQSNVALKGVGGKHLCIEGPALSGRRGGSHSGRTK